MNLENQYPNNEKYQENLNKSNEEQEKRHERTKLYKTIGKIVLIFMVIVGIILGSENPKEVLTYKSSISTSYDTYEEQFNTELMIICWSAGVSFNILFQIVNSICYRLDLIIDKE